MVVDLSVILRVMIVLEEAFITGRHMSSRFRKELTTVPSVRIQVRSYGLTTTIGWSGDAPTNARTAARQGSGFSLQQIGNPQLSGPLPTDRYLIPGTRKDYGGGDVSEMTSSGLDSFKDLLVAKAEATRDKGRYPEGEMATALSLDDSGARLDKLGLYRPTYSKTYERHACRQAIRSRYFGQ